ncbi:MAG TPA: helix-turn-helix domain-containing protein [Nocardioides sp.]|uniref:helix-turn-helix domain-containing protein n=1 Tax=uncultured Nocardioides sp. TaxID=198441 RepID=UPI000ECB5EFB|nr:helix-turn-helix domain-containing protein [uncultured Nocardioides sp.]HCB07749.1 transcriptional regulator [Nocardioides sp.]HRI95250.1 helix-turn-helix domain-containing protein [Nocardioides sp.]HRK44646.1 helix-turn-helix domain-containing protein [Nocardioides sp.]
MEIRALQDVAAAVRGRRQSLKLTQTALANQAGVSRTFISDLEGGKLTVELRSVIAVVEALGYTLALLNPDQAEPTSTTLKPTGVGSPNEFDLDELLDDYDQGRP